ncbi:DUF2892 domain-containing protein [Oxalobacteraceae bacterium]|nr:DUF2892 domain-containing protein [Oxalobacteraceae bacterium]
MHANVGNTDRALRVAAGLALVLGSVSGLIGAWGWIGVVPLLTGALRYCPAYAIFGWNTCAGKR